MVICGVVGIVIAGLVVLVVRHVRRSNTHRGDVDVESFLANLDRVHGDQPGDDGVVTLPAARLAEPQAPPPPAAAAS